MKKLSLIFIYALILLCNSCAKLSGKNPVYSIVQGVYDAKNLGTSDIHIMEGGWVFIPQEFTDPSLDFSKYTRFEHINTSWNHYAKPLPTWSYATYAVKIKNLRPERIYAIKTSTVCSAFTAYLNGKEFFRSGTVSSSRDAEVFSWNAPFVILPTQGATEATLVFHVSNFNTNKPGFLKPIEIGFYPKLSNAKTRMLLVHTILAGVLLITAAFFLSLFLFYPKEKYALYFGVLSAIFSIRICCYDEFLLTIIIPQMNANTLFKLGYITFPAGVIFASLFLNTLFGKIKKIYMWGFLLPAFAYIMVIFFTPIYVSANLLFIIQIYTLLPAIYNITIIIAAVLKRNKLAYLMLCGVIFFFVLMIRDILISNRIIEGVFLSHIGIFAILIPMAIIVLKNFQTTFENLANLANQIEATNESLAKFVPNEFMNFLNKKHIDVQLGDNVLKDMYIAFIHLGLYTGLETEKERLTLLKIYNQTLAHINPIIEKHRGFIDKYLTEGLMVLFYGSTEDVIRCMLEIRTFINKENINRQADNLPDIKLGIGVHYGKLMLGTIGEKDRMDCTVISDAVNVASRLHFYALKKGVHIYVSEIVKSRFSPSSADIAEFLYGGQVRFRGKDTPIRIYEVNAV
ncbi:adenylate/guanylate cyclase domain-containing protein [Treponema phagedenis]|uniref:adenylate/guanylate cyclase domain-containing protein n=1 Tax=Treponema phagedenis TaxID=162 RepID=UPI0016532F37|nr:adenylate/guanylate cyclase domain-containing protein [Treponema phagedenis]